MPNNKRHHFVPQFQLRNFSPDADRKFVRMFNIAKGKHVHQASISTQCCKDYFYGKDQIVEGALCSLEGEASKIFANAIAHGKLPARNCPSWRLLFDTLVVQLGRTEAATEELNNTIDKFAKYMLANTHPELKTDGMKIGWKDAAQISVTNHLLLSPILHDLDCKILKAKNCEFIISDNPVVMFNQIFDHRSYATALGMTSQGLQIYFPIAADTALLFFDNSYYKVGSGLEVCAVFPQDAKQLNTIQYLNAYSNVYYRSEQTSKLVEAIAFSGVAAMRKIGGGFKSMTIEKNGDTRRDLIVTSRPRMPFMPNLRIVTLPKHRPRSLPRPRDELWTAIVTEFVEAIEVGRQKYEHFGRFVADHPLTPGVEWLKAAIASSKPR